MARAVLWSFMTFQQNIDRRALEPGRRRMASPRRRSKDGVSSAAKARWTWLREAHDERAACRCCACPRKTDDIGAIARPRARLARRREPISCSSAPAAPASAARRWRSSPVYGVPRRRRVARRAAHPFHGQSRSAELRRAAGEASARDLALRRDLQIRRHRRDADADRGRARGAAGGGPAGNASASMFLGLQRAGEAGGKRNGLRDLLEPDGVPVPRARYRRRRPLLGADQCRPAAGGRSSASTSWRCARGRRRRSRRCSARKPAREVPSARRRGPVDRAGRDERQDHLRGDGLCRPAGEIREVVRAALGRKPRQGRQGHDADRRARPGRSAQPAAAVHRGTARQAVHGHHHRRRRKGPQIDRRAGEAAPARPTSPGKTIGDLVAAQGRATAETLAKNGCPVRTLHVETDRRGGLSASC